MLKFKKDLVEKLNLKIISGESGIHRVVKGGYVCDLLSDVMGNAVMGNIWITLQTHKNVLAIASLKDLSCIILIKSFQPDSDTIEQSNLEEIPILSTNKTAFEITGELYNLLGENDSL